jgi:hypothetical protein
MCLMQQVPYATPFTRKRLPISKFIVTAFSDSPAITYSAQFGSRCDDLFQGCGGKINDQSEA